MIVERLKEEPKKNPNLLVKVTEMGNIVEVQYMEHRNNKQTILKMDKDHVMCVSTGEEIEIKHNTSRGSDKGSLRETFARMRALINTNVTDVKKVRWCTLTYKENMTDTERLYQDFKKFNQRFQYYCKSKGYSKPEYIVMMEPQGRGAWHAHLLYIWEDQNAPYISNKDFAELWGHGFVKIKKLDDVDNVGAYLTAYLGDMEVQEVTNHKDQEIRKMVEVEEDGKKIKKSIVKGARLDLYPPGFNMIRHSQGVKEPVEMLITQEMAKEKVLGATKTFSSSFKISDDDFENVIIKEQYNKVRKIKQETFNRSIAEHIGIDRSLIITED